MTDTYWQQLEELREQMAEASRGLTPGDALLAYASRLGSILAEAAGATEALDIQHDVLDFFLALDLPIGDTPAIRNPQINADLILEEARETAEAITGRKVKVEFVDGEPAEREQSLAGAVDGMCDQLATIFGAAITFGVDLYPFWDLVHVSNMAKSGGPKREDGKQLKPPGWEPPDIPGLLLQLYPGVCFVCGCTTYNACQHPDHGPCGWAEPGRCTACAPDAAPGWEHPGEVAA